jgi:methylated-DNA-[protein]-cysteine S-methyltransferase
MTKTTDAPLWLDHLDTPLGRLALVVAGDRLRQVGFTDADGRTQRTLATLEATVGLTPRQNPNGLTAALRAYFAGDVRAIDGLPVDLRGTAFQTSVWRALLDIPCGETTSYGELARRIGRPSAVRAVGLANGANPVGIVVPCHRVIGASGNLTGYGGGLPRKRWLLAHEASQTGAPAQQELVP